MSRLVVKIVVVIGIVFGILMKPGSLQGILSFALIQIQASKDELLQYEREKESRTASLRTAILSHSSFTGGGINSSCKKDSDTIAMSWIGDREIEIPKN